MRVHMEWSPLSPRKIEIELNKEAGDEAYNMANHTDWQPILHVTEPSLSSLSFCFLRSHSSPVYKATHMPVGSW